MSSFTPSLANGQLLRARRPLLVGGSTPFPSTIDPALYILQNAVGWWETDHASNLTVGGKFSQVTDLSGNGNHWTQGTDANRPAVGSGSGLTWAEFDGITSYMDIASATAALMNNFNTGGTAIFALRIDTAGGGGLGRVFMKRTSGAVDSGEYWFVEGTPTIQLDVLFDYATTDARDRITAAFTAGDKHVISARVDKTGGAADLVVNVDAGSNLTEGAGLDNVDGLTHGAGAVVDLTGGSMRIGNRTALDRQFDGGIFAAAFFSTVLSNSDNFAVMARFNGKCGAF